MRQESVAIVRLAVGLALLAGVCPAAASTLNSVGAVSVAPLAGGRAVVIETSREPTFTVFRLYDPMRVVIDISGADIGAHQAPIEVQDGLIGDIAFHCFRSGKRSIGRVMVGFVKELRYEVRAEGRRIVLEAFTGEAGPVGRAPPPPAPPVDPEAVARAEQARQQAERAAAEAQGERDQALAMQQELAQQQRAIAQREASIEAQRQEVEQAGRAATALAARAESALQQEREQLRSQQAEAQRRLAEAEQSQRRLQAEQDAARQTLAALQQAQAAAEAAAQQAEATARAKLAEAEQALARATEARSLAEARLAAAEQQRLHAEQAKNLAAAERQELAAQKGELDQRRQALQQEQQRQQQVASQVAQQKAALERDRAAYQRLSEELQAERAALSVARQQLAVERAALAAERQADASTAAATTAGERRALAAAQQDALQARQAAEQAQARLATLQADLGRAQAALQAKEREVAAANAATPARDPELERLRGELERTARELKAAQGALGAAEARTTAGDPARDLTVGPAPRPATAGTPGKRPARKRPARPAQLTAVRAIEGGLLLAFRGPAPDPEVLTLTEPTRLVLDLPGASAVKGLPMQQPLGGTRGGLLHQVRIGAHPDALRVVLDLNARAMPAYTVRPERGGLAIRLTPGAEAAIAATPTPPASSSVAHVGDVGFERGPGHALVTVRLDREPIWRVDDSPARAYVLELEEARIPVDLERALDTSAFGSTVTMVSSYQDRTDPPLVKVLVNVSSKVSQTVRWQGGALRWEFVDLGGGTLVAAEALGADQAEPDEAATPSAAGSFASQTAALAQGATAQLGAARGGTKRITIDLKDADVVNVIRLVAEVSGENIITSDEVKGKITLKLRNVPWEQALDLILATKGYGKVRKNNIIRIAPLEALQREKELELQKKKAEQLVEEPIKKVLAINYATASELREQLVPLLSGRGSIQAVDRTNTLIINELPDKIADIVKLASKLDTQTPQVLIEARIVEAASNFLQQLGIQWGGISARSPAFGNPTGLSFPNTFVASGAADDPQTNLTGGVLSPSNYAVNLPAPIATGTGGGIGLSFGNLNNSSLLTMRLTALEETGAARIISAPRVATLDNKKAKIEQGIDIPISVVSAAGVNTKFIPASLVLEVQPHVTNDGSVLMKINVSKNEPDFSRTGASGDPTIQKKNAETEVLVRDGDTTVIGGIYTRTTTQVNSEVPFVAKIPILGWLFRNTRHEDNRAELLVFITPRILNREASSVAADAVVGEAPPLPLRDL